ncbi:RsmE family RNA methyltransferase [Oribacterium sp. WCC10]|uniref:RsmE family RNA methyltransferase n=1 Tax=Oribacterium sp. WCC10 TaxID=1855343 RepID=UPI0008E93BD4|nr:16S rRNA (uracil(1498)-N(3))-methyltransferase [Oribacterium sp. WCC10]SFG38999.1 16S rRNA (uracil1498-N3)-methyltransferase [Oribacterium sp. WCC10]
MHHFFVERSNIDSDSRKVFLTGDNYNHLKNVLRVRVGEKILISDGEGTDYECDVITIHDENYIKEARESGDMSVTEPEVVLHINFVEEIHELPADIYLFQGLPKQDKMELIIQKAVELGAHAVIPLDSKNTVIKLDDKRQQKKTDRWQAIAEAAAKQSKRSIIPEVMPVMKWKAAMEYVKDFDLKLIPYENAKNIKHTMEELNKLPEHGKIAVFIGPEGGFTDGEIEDALQHGIEPVTLGKRILRTETAAITSLSVLMLMLEAKADQDTK